MGVLFGILVAVGQSLFSAMSRHGGLEAVGWLLLRRRGCELMTGAARHLIPATWRYAIFGFLMRFVRLLVGESLYHGTHPLDCRMLQT